MRVVKERKPEYIKDGKAVYNPGFVDRYQKPWYIQYNYNIKYYGRFSKKGYPGSVRLEFDSLRQLINKITGINPSLKNEIMDTIEEMEDAHYAEQNSYRESLPSAD